MLLITEKGHDATLVVDVRLLTDERILHLVDLLLEVFLVLTSQQLLNALKSTFSLSNRIDLNALDEHLDQWSGLWELSPSQWQAVEGDRESLLGCTSNHELENCDTQRIDVLQHDYLLLFTLRDLGLLLGEGPVAGLGVDFTFNRCLWGKVSYLIDDVLIFHLKHDLTQIKLTMNKARIVSKVHSLGKLNRYIIYHLDVGAGHVDCEIQIELLDVLVDIAIFVFFDHGELSITNFLGETVKRCHDI